jgi:hypothetical protein
MNPLSAEGDRGRNSGSDSMPPTEMRIGPFTVSADAAAAAAFRQATPQVAEADAASELPFTFPLRWLTRAEIREAVAQLIPSEEGKTFLPLHESQSFDYAASLRPGADYCMTVDIRRDHQGAQLVLHSEIGPDAGVVHLRMDMVLRFVAIEDGRAQRRGFER